MSKRSRESLKLSYDQEKTVQSAMNTTLLGRMERRYLDLLSSSLRDTMHSFDPPLTPLEFHQAELTRARVAEEFREEIEALRKKEPTDDPEDRRLREILLDPNLAWVISFLRVNRRASHTLLHPEALESLQRCILEVIENGIPGDLMECGVYKGGACIYMRGVLEALEEKERKVWVADSFAGLPEPDRKKNLKDAVVHSYLREVGSFQVTLDSVRGSFAAYDLLDRQVKFLPGWFNESLPGFSRPLALLRCDADWYDSTVDVLENLYQQVSPGGIVIIDDYAPLFGAYQAVNEFRQRHNVTAPLVQVHDAVHFWRKP